MPSQPSSRLGSAMRSLLTLALAATPAIAGDDDQAWIRVTETDSTITLESVSRAYSPIDGDGPVIHLVGAVHIGDWEFYDRVQSLLDGVPVVLWEGVGGGFDTVDDPAVRDNDEALRERSQRKIRFLDTVARLSGAEPQVPQDIFDAVPDALQDLVIDAMTDAWGNPVWLENDEGSWAVVSLGADGKPGGEGLDADIHSDDHISPPETIAGGGLQSDLASALGLIFQMDGVDYQRAHWRNSDLSVSELRRAFNGEDVGDRPSPAIKPKKGAASQREPVEAGGADGSNDQTDALLKMMSGEGMLAGVMKFVTRLMSKTPSSQAKAKIMLSETLSHAEALLSMQQGPAAELMQVLIHQRNDRVLYDIDQIRAHEPEVKQLAVFYGGGHLPAMAEALVERGYEPAGDIWFPAITVDLEAEGLDRAQLEQSRKMIKMFIEMSIPKMPE